MVELGYSFDVRGKKLGLPNLDDMPIGYTVCKESITYDITNFWIRLDSVFYETHKDKIKFMSKGFSVYGFYLCYMDSNEWWDIKNTEIEELLNNEST